MNTIDSISGILKTAMPIIEKSQDNYHNKQINKYVDYQNQLNRKFTKDTLLKKINDLQLAKLKIKNTNQANVQQLLKNTNNDLATYRNMMASKNVNINKGTPKKSLLLLQKKQKNSLSVLDQELKLHNDNLDLELNLLNKKKKYLEDNELAKKQLDMIIRRKQLIKQFRGDVKKVDALLSLYKNYKQ